MGEWKEEFDKRFVDNLGWADKHVYRDGGRIHIERVKAFIEKVRQEAIREVIEDIPDEGDFLSDEGNIFGTYKPLKDQLKAKFL